MKDREIILTIQDIAGESREFKSIRALYSFTKKEGAFWNRIKENINKKKSINDATLNAHVNFEQITTMIESWKENLAIWTDQELSQHIQQLQRSYLKRLPSLWLWSGHPCVDTFVKCFDKFNQQTATAFLNYVVKNQFSINNNDVNAFNGAMLGYEFTNQSSDITKRRSGEKKSLGQLRNSYADAQNSLFSEVDEIKSSIGEWDDKTQNKFSRLYKANKYLGEKRIKHHDKYFDENLRNWSSTIDELEKTYEEKLRLKKPAEYWNKAAKKYGLQGSLWSLAIVALVIVGMVYFREFFITWLGGQEIGIKLNTIQGAILFGSFAAIYAYLLRVISRLAFSAFHLMRDAEEREQLTYLYLSLINESAIDRESRDIILQALFSRSETGLLAQEHGPTMPGISAAMKVLGKGGK